MSKIKVCILGYYDVGKTALSLRYAMDEYNYYNQPIIEDDFFSKQLILTAKVIQRALAKITLIILRN